jgi:dTMP kinase
MKVKAILLAAASFLFTWDFHGLGVFFALFVTILFTGYGLVKSISKSLDPLNDAPNGFRALLASFGGLFLASPASFLIPSAGLFMILGGILLNDEYQRRVVDSIRQGRRGGAVAFLGIDGSGKSSHAAVTGNWLRGRGYYCEVVAFHRYLFVEHVSGARRRIDTNPGPKQGGNPFRPVLSLVDNMLLHLLSTFGAGVAGRVVLYDRFIWSTFVKYYALGYPVRPLSSLYLLPRPKCAVVFDIPVIRSLNVIDEREQHTKYTQRVLTSEREFYLQIATNRGYPIVDSRSDFEKVQTEVESYLSFFFPVVRTGALD